MVAEVIPFYFPRIGQMTVTDGSNGILNVGFMFPNGLGALVARGMGERLFRLIALNSDGFLAYLPEILGEGVETVHYLTEAEVTVLLERIAGLPSVL